ncbi:MAG: substrate-binding domain-containing protein [Acidobacteria bacterium]|nr:substrate-binding domain-containing protein [Acidobacteriota bacterium]
MRTYLPAILLSALLLSACGGGDGPKEGTLTIAVIPMGTTHEHWKAIHAGAVKAGRELGVEIVWKGPQKEDDREQQIAVVEDMVARQVDGIVLAPLDRAGLRQVVREAKAAGIPTVCVDSGLEGDDHVSLVATDNYDGGVAGAKRLAEILDGKGKIIMMRAMVGVESTGAREQGFLDEIRKFPEIEILSDNQYGGVTVESGYQMAENLLNRFRGDVTGIFTPNESTTFGMLRALTDAGLTGKVKFVGFDTSDKLIQALEAGDIQGLVLQNPFKMGEEGVRTIVDKIKGQSVPNRVDTGIAVATPENRNDPEVAKLLRPPLSEYLDE